MKWWIMAITLGIYYLTPWIRWDRGPDLPDQAVLVDLAGRRFFFFWIEIWPHEFYFIAGLLIMAGLGLFLFTSALGRVWCGYACPQTVWTDLFMIVERWVEGDRNAQIRLLNQKYDLHKLRLRLTKWTLWLLVAIATGGAWVFYFADAPTLLIDLVTGAAHPVAYISVAILTATTLVFGGFMREQVCIYMCPWPRIQAAMMDEATLTVAYRDWRGEPRAKGAKRRDMTAEAERIATEEAAIGRGAAAYQTTPLRGLATAEQAPAFDLKSGPGDCIECMACVNVCPMGIDIRDGQQLECITCALCIDACDDVMTRIGKPRGLIDYLSLADEKEERAGGAAAALWKRVFRPRVIVYTAAWSFVGLALLFALFIRSEVDLNASAVRNPVFVTLSDGSIRNAYDIRIRNKTGSERTFRLSLTSDQLLRINLEGTLETRVTVPADETFSQRVYAIARPGDPAASADSIDLRFWAEDVESGERAYANSRFRGTGDAE